MCEIVKCVASERGKKKKNFGSTIMKICTVCKVEERWFESRAINYQLCGTEYLPPFLCSASEMTRANPRITERTGQDGMGCAWRIPWQIQ